MKTVEERFLDYIKFNTQSDDLSTTCPSTSCQVVFGKYLAMECEKIGLSGTKIDDKGYVSAYIPANALGYSSIGFIAHMDTSPDSSGENISPIITKNYNGNIIKRKGEPLSPKEFPELLNYIGKSIITSDGTTLLGADDKAGIAEILTAMEYIINTPSIKHGKIAVAFTPDEEIGRGADFFDVSSFDCDFAYTIDGGKIGELEYENFNAARVKIEIQGINVHPGYAKGLMKNATLIGLELSNMLPKNDIPEQTENYEGFYHLIKFNSTVDKCQMAYIIRDFYKESFEDKKTYIKNVVDTLNKKYGNIISIAIKDEYYNMSEKIEPNMHIIALAKKAMEECQIVPNIAPIRGGTDGARLSFMGLPCPNIFSGGHNFHGIYEFIPIESMEKATEVIIKIISLAKT